jgi:hypothetical protein
MTRKSSEVRLDHSSSCTLAGGEKSPRSRPAGFLERRTLPSRGAKSSSSTFVTRVEEQNTCRDQRTPLISGDTGCLGGGAQALPFLRCISIAFVHF